MRKYSEESSIEAFDTIWNTVIEKLIKQYKAESFYISVEPNAQDLIWKHYVDFREHCRAHYMIESSDLLDRHKVCACLIYSIVKSSVISHNISNDKNNSFYSVINEDLALTTGLTLLRAFIISAATDAHDNGKLDSDELNRIKKIFENGIKFPPTNHGSYRENFLAELHFTMKEENYNILSLAQVLFLLETYTKNSSE